MKISTANAQKLNAERSMQRLTQNAEYSILNHLLHVLKYCIDRSALSVPR